MKCSSSNDSALRVALVLDRLCRGGKERVVQLLAGRLAKLGHAVAVVTMRDATSWRDELTAAGVTIYELHSQGSFDVRGIGRLAKWLTAWRPDVINVHDRSSLPYAAMANRFATRAAMILSCHGLLQQAQVKHGLRRWLERWALSQVSEITAVSDVAGRAYYRLLELYHPMAIVANGIDAAPFMPDQPQQTAQRRAMRKQIHIEEFEFVFLSVGNVKPEKGYDDLLNACKQLRQTSLAAHFRCVIVGSTDGEYAQSLQARCREEELTDCVLWAGPSDDVAAWYATADAFVMSSRTEGLPMVLLEAMAAGRPVVATAVGDIPSVLAGGVGKLVPPDEPTRLAEAMAETMKNCPANAGELQPPQQRGRQRVETQYSTAAMAEGYLQVFRSAAMRVDKKANRPAVLQVAPQFPQAGGMVSVCDTIRRSRLQHDWPMAVLPNGKLTSERRSLRQAIIAQLGMLGRLIRWTLGRRRAIVHIHTCSGFTFWRDGIHLTAVRLLRAKAILHIHGGGFVDFLHTLSPLPSRTARWLLGSADAVIALFDQQASDLNQFVPAAQVDVIPNGLPATVDEPLDEFACDDMNLPPVFLFLGNLGKNKGAFDLLPAAEALAAKGLSFRVVIAGGETQSGQMEQLQAAIAERQLDATAMYAGVLSGEAKQSHLQQAAAVLLPSYREAFPMAVLEAMQAGKPVIATRAGAVEQMIEDGRTGLLYDAGDVAALRDAMRKIIEHSDEAQLMGRHGRARWKEYFTDDKQAQRLDALYRRLLRMADPQGGTS